MIPKLPDPAGSRAVLIGTSVYTDPRLPDIPGVANNLTDRASLSTGATSGLAFAANLLSRDPGFRDAAMWDFHLRPGSPAIGAGRHLANVLGDLNRTSRVATAPDIGAYQYNK